MSFFDSERFLVCMNGMRLLCITLIFSFCAGFAFSQDGDELVVRGTMYNGDTIPMVNLAPVDVWEKRTWKSKRKEKKYSRLKKKVIKVYPYAKLAGIKLEEYADRLDTVQSKRQRKKFYKEIEADLKAEYGSELKKLSMSEGRILIKLIDRETGNTSYQLVDDLRGKLTAFFWQGFARVFGHDLKADYDPEGKDKEIEYIVTQIEAGII